MSSPRISSWRHRRSTHRPGESALHGSRNILENLQPELVRHISKPASSATEERVRITSVDYVGSYDWVDKPTPTIIVPGFPRLWKNRATPYQVQADTGSQLKDQNGFRCPKSVLLPIVTAVNWMSKDKEFDWKSIDFVTSRNSLRQLLRWIRGDANDFRIDMQFTRNTVFLNRWESSYHMLMHGNTFGFNFEKASTNPAPGCDGSTGHHRVIRYEFSGLMLVVGYEVDACMLYDTSPTSPNSPSSKILHSSDNIDDLVGALKSVSLHGEEEREPPSSTAVKSLLFSDITVIPGGSIVPQSAIIELTSRSAARIIHFKWEEAYPQLYLSQTPHYFLGVHERGRFQEVMKRKLGSVEMEDIADDNQADLRTLRSMLSVIKELAIEYGDEARLSLVCQNGEMKVYRRISEADCLPDPVLDLFKK